MIVVEYSSSGIPINDFFIPIEVEYARRNANSIEAVTVNYSTENVVWAIYLEVVMGNILPSRVTFYTNDRRYVINATTLFIETEIDGKMVADSTFLNLNSNLKKQIYQYLLS